MPILTIFAYFILLYNIFFLYNYSSTQNLNFLIPDDAIHTLIGKRSDFYFYLRS